MALIFDWIRKAWAGKISRRNISLVFLVFSGIQLIMAIFILQNNMELFYSRISGIFYLIVGILLLIISIEAKITVSYELFEEANVWIKWLFYFLLMTYICVLLMEYPHTKSEFNVIVITIVSTVCALFLPSWINSVKSSETE